MEAGEEDDVLHTSISGLEIVGGEAYADKTETSERKNLSTVPNAFKSAGLKAKDITQQFTRSASALKTGELVKDGSFSLFDAVGALEIMDPKMDSGFLAAGDTLEDDYDVSKNLRPEEVLGIMDALLSVEVAWHMGHPLSQTLFTSIYVDHLLWPEPAALEDASFCRRSTSPNGSLLVHVVLRSYCLALIKACDYVHQSICAETFFEEEDFVSNLFNRSLLANFSSDEISVLLEHAITAVRTNAVEVSPDIQEGLLARLEYRSAFLRAVMGEPRKLSLGGEEHWRKCLERLATIEGSHVHAVSVDESFSVKIQRRLASTVPPRPIIRLAFPGCVIFLRQLFRNAIDVVGIRECQRVSSILNFLQIFCSQKPQPAVYIRCILQGMIFEQTRGPHLERRREFFFQDLEEIVLPAHILIERSNGLVEAPQDPRFKIWSRMSEVIEHVCEPFFDIIRALCMNRSRARRMLCNLVYEWDELQLDLEDFDKESRDLTGERPVFDDIWEFPISSWSYFYKLRQMQWIVQLGFELQLYHTDEWPGMYWYLQEVAEHRRKHIERIYAFVYPRAKDSHKLPGDKQAILEHTQTYLAVATEETVAIQALAESFAYLYQALSILQLLPKPPPRPYGTTELRHALRLRPFLPLVIPTYDSPSEPFVTIDNMTASLPITPEYKSLSNEHQRALALLDASDSANRQARKAWDAVSKASASSAGCVGCEMAWRAGIKEILRAAVTSGIAGARVRKWILGGASSSLIVTVHTGTRDDEMLGGLASAWLVPQISV